jgi:hypothetical protein
METLEYIISKYHVDITTPSPIKLPIGRSQLPELFKNLEFKIGVEVGVDRGFFSEELCVGNPDAKLYCIDPWVEYSDFNRRFKQHIMNKYYQQTVNRLKSYNCEIIRKKSIDGIKEFEDESIEYVYIDSLHDYNSCIEDLTTWSKKVRRGGVISGHDYREGKLNQFGTRYKVFDAVNDFTKNNNIHPFFITSENTHSFLWIK